MAMDPRMAQQMQQMMSGMGEEQSSGEQSQDAYALADFTARDAKNDQLGGGGKDANGNYVHRSLDPRLASSRQFGFLWANKQIEKLIKNGDSKNPDFISDLRFYLMHNPARGPQYPYVHSILGSAPKHISPQTRAAAIRLLSEFDCIVDSRDLDYETPAYKAVKLGDLASLTAIAQASNGKNVLEYTDLNNNNLLSIAADKSPEMVPFLLRSGIKSSSNNEGMHCVDLALKSFLSSVQYDPKDSFDKLYIVMSSLKKAGDPRTLKLFEPDNLDVLNRAFQNLSKEHQACMQDMLSSIKQINSDTNVLFTKKAPLFTNAVRKDKNGNDIPGHAVTYLDGVPLTNTGYNVDVGASLFRKSAAMGINVFDYSYTTLKNAPFKYTDLNPREFVSIDSRAKQKMLSSNVSFLINKLDTLVSKTGFMSKLAGTSISSADLARYQPMLVTLRELEQKLKSPNSDIDNNLFELGANIQSIKDELNKERMDQALASLTKQIDHVDPATGKKVSGIVNIHQFDLGMPMDNSNGDTLLTFACRNNHIDTINFCLNNDANLHCVDKFGNTPLHIAAEHGNFELINKLIGHYNGSGYEGIHKAKSVASLNVLNTEGKTFLDVLHESLPSDKFNKIYAALLEKHPVLKNESIWDVPFWSVDLAEQKYLANNSPEQDMLHISHKPIFALENADKFLDTDETKLHRNSTNNQAEDDIHYFKLKNDILEITSLLQRSDLTDTKRAALSKAFELRVKNLSVYQQIGFMIESFPSKDTDPHNYELDNLKIEASSKIARGILSEFRGADLSNLSSLTPKQREILDAFEKSDTPVPSIISGLAVLSMHDGVNKTVNNINDYSDAMAQLKEYSSKALSAKYMPLYDEDLDNKREPKPN